jgi:uncharacterized protein (TIGR02145 family)
MTYIMKHIKVKISIVLLLGLGIIGIQAQDYKISFSGSVKSTNVDIVNVLNLTQGTELTLNKSETLHLVGTNTSVETQLSGENNLLIYPNPSGETSNIKFYNSKAGQVIIEISDITGKIIIRRSQQLAEGSHTFRISGMSNGIYLVNIYCSDRRLSGKLLSNFGNSRNTSIEYLGSDLAKKPKYNLKSTQNLVQMQYNDGEWILVKGISGNYSSVLTFIPTQDSTINFEFIECTDADSNHYATVTIGTQTWMAENLRTTRYADGTAIQLLTAVDSVFHDSQDNPHYLPSGWDTICGITCCSDIYSTCKAYGWPLDDISYANPYGALYSWRAAMNGATSSSSIPSGIQGVCPTGWHLPSHEEWIILKNFLGGEDFAGGKLKETGSDQWWSPNEGATNESGFTALPSGRAGESFLGGECFWWSSTDDAEYSNVPTALKGYIIAYSTGLYLEERGFVTEGLSVRCVKDFDMMAPPPVVITEPATNISANSAIFNGTVNANGVSTIVTFEYQVYIRFARYTGWVWHEVTASQSPVTGTSLLKVSADFPGLPKYALSKQINFRVKAANSCGTYYGEILKFALH